MQAFERASLNREYYEDFDVNSKNCMEQSRGTSAWIASFLRLLDRCVTEAQSVKAKDVRQTFDVLFGLLDHINECCDDVVFFADEGGSWQVGVDWAEVLPTWFSVLSATAAPEEYATRIVAVVEDHCAYRRDETLALAARVGSAEQREALVARTRNANRDN